MQAIRAGSAYSLILCLNNTMLMNPELTEAVSEDCDEEDDG
jgi:hypothetical protein